MTFTRKTLSSGIPSLDLLLGGGLPQSQTLLITGEPGCGKTVLASQVAFNFAARGLPAVIATTTSESQIKLLADLEGFSWFKREVIGEELYFVSVYPWLKKGAKDARDLLVNTVKERKAKLLVVDGMRTVRDLWLDEARLREFLHDLAVALASHDCTAILLTEYKLEKLMDLPESTTVDGIISVTNEGSRSTRVRRAEVTKLRGMDHLRGKHVMRVDGDGIRIFPRLESVTGVGDDQTPITARAGFGLKELDSLTHGGLPGRTATLVAGGTGIGKTLLCLHFLAEGARQGETTMLFSASESAERLIQRAERVGLQLRPHIEAGLINFRYAPNFELEADEITDRILREVAEKKVTRLVIEDVDLIEAALDDPRRATPFFAALMVRLHELGVTTLFTRKISKLVGPELDFSDTALAGIAENLLFLRHVELRGRIHRLMSVLNLRDSPFEPTLREFEIRDSGFAVMAPIQSADGLLTGLARPLGTEIREGQTR